MTALSAQNVRSLLTSAEPQLRERIRDPETGYEQLATAIARILELEPGYTPDPLHGSQPEARIAIVLDLLPCGAAARIYLTRTDPPQPKRVDVLISKNGREPIPVKCCRLPGVIGLIVGLFPTTEPPTPTERT